MSGSRVTVSIDPATERVICPSVLIVTHEWGGKPVVCYSDGTPMPAQVSAVFGVDPEGDTYLTVTFKVDEHVREV